MKQTESVTESLRRSRQAMHEEIGRTAETLSILRTLNLKLVFFPDFPVSCRGFIGCVGKYGESTSLLWECGKSGERLVGQNKETGLYRYAVGSVWAHLLSFCGIVYSVG